MYLNFKKVLIYGNFLRFIFVLSVGFDIIAESIKTPKCVIIYAYEEMRFLCVFVLLGLGWGCCMFFLVAYSDHRCK
jgi:hypothetical protein